MPHAVGCTAVPIEDGKGTTKGRILVLGGQFYRTPSSLLSLPVLRHRVNKKGELQWKWETQRVRSDNGM